MRCAIESVTYLLHHYGIKETRIIDELNSSLQSDGISIYDLVVIANANSLKLQARKSIFLPNSIPCILYYRHKKGGHYNVLVSKNWYSLTVYDGEFGKKTINKWWFYIFYSHIYIVCYND